MKGRPSVFRTAVMNIIQMCMYTNALKRELQCLAIWAATKKLKGNDLTCRLKSTKKKKSFFLFRLGLLAKIWLLL